MPDEFMGEGAGLGADEGAASASPPDISDALSQMQEHMQRIESRLPAEPPANAEAGYVGDQSDDPGGVGQYLHERYGDQQPDPYEEYTVDGDYDDDAGYDDYGDPQQQAADAVALVQQLGRESAQEAVGEFRAEFEQQRNEEQILAFADQHPELRDDPHMLNSIADDLDGLAEHYGDPRLATDAGLVQRLYYAKVAEQAGAAEAADPTRAPSGTGLETGAGPGVPTQQPDRLESALGEVITGDPSNPFR